jgi:hypothetical protein
MACITSTITIVPAASVGALAILGNHALQSQQAGVSEKIRADLSLSTSERKILSTWRAKSREGLALRTLSGSLRRFTRISKA